MSKGQKEQLIVLGKKPGPEMKKDAIHIALMPCVAGQKLHPGDHVGLKPDGKMYRRGIKESGIVDPFLEETVETGERFWLFFYQNSITGLRHEYDHPDFPNESVEKGTEESLSYEQKYLNKVAEKLGFSYPELREVVLTYVQGDDKISYCLVSDEFEIEDGDSRLEFWNGHCRPEYSEFWKCFEKVENIEIDKRLMEDAWIFRCAC